MSEEETRRPADRSLDMTALRGLAHPLRVRMLDVLSTYGPQTASSLAERLAESSGVTSYHLRQLEQHHFIREVKGRGTARERWWERVPGGISIDSATLPSTAAARAANAIVTTEWHRNREALLGDFVRRGEHELSRDWIEASVVNTANARVTSEQLAELTAELERVTDEFLDRHRHQFGTDLPGTRPVQIQLSAFPVLDAGEAPDPRSTHSEE
ncbi:helix-turn-helix domain-containing protein [Herbiconiux sp. KACC 21604]|uniref:winged helix-turn-helix domain-containing protein n=1 Tax=unclassified Herbiconiux TaxID=2618217 RepID=UPI001491AF13|nr:helix-turn-helix domain-containing protein [Herbiconiux sp. SALV-R1]QJU55253.1 helix-turn-helix transcriptional regulator [Herbiconiux sp. SALV-R1]WPO86420.1 helix-turn-helix domain-containing protein [Herbiconiux sp. KACC 21604]